MKSDRLIEEIKSRVDIVEFISDYVQLKKAGQNYKALCPFHSEKTPSFMVSPSKQIFHCFGCGIGGDVIRFLMKHENISFNEAKIYIAKKAGIKINEKQLSKDMSEKRIRMFKIQRDALEFFKGNLKSSDLAKKYLKKRGIEEDSINAFCVGYAPDKTDALFKYLKIKGYSDSFIHEAGLAFSDKKIYRDTFRGRIIFPIFNIRGDVIAFGGRVIDNSMPKYLNSPETEIFKKGEILFGIHLSKDEIRKKGFAIIVEGYLDTIMCHQYGFKNTLSPLGTALTDGQLKRLKTQTDKVTIVFDSDEAGIVAAKRSIAALCELDFKTKILLLPKGEDPDSFLRRYGTQEFQKLLSNPMTMIEFLLRTSKGDRINNIREALAMTALFKDLIIADEMIIELSDRSGINESVLRSELKKIKKKERLHEKASCLLTQKVKNIEEYLLLSAVIAFPEKVSEVISRLNIEELREVPIKSLFEKIKASGDIVDIDSIINDANEEEKIIVRELTINPGFDLDNVDKNIHDCLFKLSQRRLEGRRNLIMVQEPDDPTLHNALLKEKRKLLKETNK